MDAIEKNSNVGSVNYTFWLGLLNRILTIVMAICLSIGIQSVSLRYFKGEYINYLVLVGFFVALEATFSMNQFYTGRNLTISTGLYRVVEWVVLFVFLKLSTYIGDGISELNEMLRVWFFNPQAFFADEKLFVVLINGVVVWIFTTIMVGSLHDIENDDRLIQSANREGLISNRDEIRQKMLNHFTVFGLFLVVTTVIIRIGEFGFDPAGISSYRSIGIGLIIFFSTGMILMSQLQFSVLLAGWLWERIPFDLRVSVRWIFTSLFILLMVLIISAQLPSEPLLGLFPSLRYLFDWFIMIVSVIIFILSLPIILLVSLLSLLFKVDVKEVPRPSLPEFPAVPQVEHGALASWLELAKSIGFWIILLGIFLFAIIQYIRQNKEYFVKIRRLGLIRWFGQVWHQIYQAWTKSRKVILEKVKQELERIGVLQRNRRLLDAWNYIRLGSLSPREQVRFFYLAILRRSSEAGINRKASQSAEEFSEQLKEFFPELSDELNTLTSGFVDARYSTHEITSEKSQLMQSVSQKIRKEIYRTKQQNSNVKN